MSIRPIAFLATLLCVAPLTVAAAYQAPDSAFAPVPTPNPAQISSPSSPPPGPRLSSQFERADPILIPSNTSRQSFFVDEGGHHTFVISTLALVLGIVLLVVLISR